MTTFYAQALIERLSLFETSGVLRLGLVHYNTPAEVDRLLEALEQLAARGVLQPAIEPPAHDLRSAA